MEQQKQLKELQKERVQLKLKQIVVAMALYETEAKINAIEHEMANIDEYQTMLLAINKGDVKALEKYGRWTIYGAHLAGKLRNAPDSIKPALTAILDSCRESL